jgi:hypothetical protein
MPSAHISELDELELLELFELDDELSVPPAFSNAPMSQAVPCGLQLSASKCIASQSKVAIVAPASMASAVSFKVKLFVVFTN